MLPALKRAWLTATGQLEQRTVDAEILARLDSLWPGKTKSGKQVTAQSALAVMAVLACVRVISEGVAQLPLHVRRYLPRGQELATDTRIYRLLNARPNEWQTALEFVEMLTIHAALTGDGYAYINRSGGEIFELIPLIPQHVSVQQYRGYRLEYTVGDGQGGIVGTFPRDRILHLRGPSWDGYRGMSVVHLAAEAVGLAMAASDSQAELHESGGRPGGLLTTDQVLKPETRAQLAEAFRKHARRGIPVLDAGLKFSAMSMTSVDAQHIETRRFQVEEICRGFRVFPQMVMHTDKTATFASAEAFFAAHVRHTLMPWCRRWAQALDRDVLDGAGPLHAWFDLREMTKAATADREKFYRTVTEMGIYTRNEIRELEGLAPLPGLDEPLTPMNMTNGQQAGGETDA